MLILDDNIYTFSLNSDDLKNRLLNYYTKDCMHNFILIMLTENLIAVRFIDPITLVLHQPYDMTYTGELLVPPSIFYIADGS